MSIEKKVIIKLKKYLFDVVGNRMKYCWVNRLSDSEVLISTIGVIMKIGSKKEDQHVMMYNPSSSDCICHIQYKIPDILLELESILPTIDSRWITYCIDLSALFSACNKGVMDQLVLSEDKNQYQLFKTNSAGVSSIDTVVHMVDTYVYDHMYAWCAGLMNAVYKGPSQSISFNTELLDKRENFMFVPLSIKNTDMIGNIRYPMLEGMTTQLGTQYIKKCKLDYKLYMDIGCEGHASFIMSRYEDDELISKLSPVKSMWFPRLTKEDITNE